MWTFDPECKIGDVYTPYPEDLTDLKYTIHFCHGCNGYAIII